MFYSYYNIFFRQLLLLNYKNVSSVSMLTFETIKEHNLT